MVIVSGMPRSGTSLGMQTVERLERSSAMQIRRGLIAMAGVLPLLASPLLAHAGALSPDRADLEQVLVSVAPPSLPADTQPNSELPPQLVVSEAQPVSPPPSAPAVVVPPPRVDEDLSLTGMAVWTGLLGKPIELAMKNGQTLEGRIIAQSAVDLACARLSDGTLVAVPKAEIAGVSLLPGVPPTPSSDRQLSDGQLSDRPTRDGRGLRAGGIITVTVGSVGALAGTALLAVIPYALFISLPTLVPGLAMVGGGVAMLVSASKKRKAFNQAWGIPTANVQLTPTVSGSRHGGQAGLILRF